MAGEVAWTPAQLMPKNMLAKRNRTAMPVNWNKEFDTRPFEIVAPSHWTAPVVFNSPHSGARYPAAFLALSRLDPVALRKSEDCHIDELFACATDLGAPLLKAHFPRAYLDVNREPYELDPRMFREELPGYANTVSMRVTAGLGTVPRIVCEGEEIYRLPLRLDEVLQRIETIYRAYHRTLSSLAAQVHDSFGAVLLIDCHSMPSSAATLVSANESLVDIVLGDRHGAACGEPITALLEDLLRAQGLKVVRNKPYAGGFITQTHGNPLTGRHALQIEINRALYMSERTFEPTGNFEPLKTVLRLALQSLLGEIDDMLKPMRLAAE
jgi:N-formylglutamate amidohydrolase